MTITQGAQANLNGKTFEEMMIPIFKINGFQVFTESELKKKYPDLSSIDIERYVIKNAYYVTIYNEGGRTEFVRNPKYNIITNNMQRWLHSCYDKEHDAKMKPVMDEYLKRHSDEESTLYDLRCRMYHIDKSHTVGRLDAEQM